VKLLFDENLSHHLVNVVASSFPGSSHVRLCGLKSAQDETVWAFAAAENFAIVSKDSEFHQRSFLFGFPPKIIWIRLGNCSTRQIAELLQTHEPRIRKFCEDKAHACLVIPE